MIIYKNVNIIESQCEVIIHNANCFHTMNSGVAKAIRAKWPNVYDADVDNSVRGDEKKLGSYTMARIKDEHVKYVLNVYMQFKYGTDERRLNYEAAYNGFVAVKEFCETMGINSLAIPSHIGCGLAGGNWNIVETMIKEVFKDATFSVAICKY